MLQEEVWNIRNVRSKEGAWAQQVGIYGRERVRRTGLPTWHLVRSVGRAYKSSEQKRLVEVGTSTGLVWNNRARHGGIAVTLSDLVPPDVESLYRLGGLRLKLVYKPSRTSANRVQVGLAERTSGPWRLRARLATVSGKQLDDITASLRLGADVVALIPRVGQLLRGDGT